MNEPFEWHWEITIREKDAEIERLKDELAHEKEWSRIHQEAKKLIYDLGQKEQKQLKSLITELVDALDKEHVSRPREFHPPNCPFCALMEKAREVVK